MGIIKNDSGGWPKAKRAIRYITPPFLVDSFRRLKGRAGRDADAQAAGGVIEWEYVPEGWRAAQTNPRIKGWDVDSVLEVYKANWPGFVRSLEGAAPLAVSPEWPSPERTDPVFHNIIMSYAYALATAARLRKSISMLDWGGGIGHYYLISQALMPDLEIDYHCKDVRVLAEHGRGLFPRAHFYTDDTCLARQYDFVFAGTSLHYSEDWAATLEGLLRATKGHAYITQLPVVQDSPSFVMLQRPYSYGYDTEYLGWCLNRREFLERAEGFGARLVREFVIGYRLSVHGAPEGCEYRGFLFRSPGRDAEAPREG